MKSGFAANRHCVFSAVIVCALLILAVAPRQAGAQGQGQPIATLFIDGPYVTLNGVPAANGVVIRGGDTVATGPASSAKAVFFAGGSVQLDANTDPEFLELLEQGYGCVVRVILNTGQVYGDGSSACVSHGPSWILPSSAFNLVVAQGVETLTVTAGHIRAGGVEWTTVPAGTQISLAAGHIIAQRRVSADEMRRITRWRGRYRFTSAAPAPAPTPGNWPAPSPPVTCPPGLIFNPRIGVCQRAGAPAAPPVDRCPAGTRYNARTRTCTPIVTGPPPSPSCPGGRYDPWTRRCVPARAVPPSPRCRFGEYYDLRTERCLPRLR